MLPALNLGEESPVSSQMGTPRTWNDLVVQNTFIEVPEEREVLRRTQSEPSLALRPRPARDAVPAAADLEEVEAAPEAVPEVAQEAAGAAQEIAEAARETAEAPGAGEGDPPAEATPPLAAAPEVATPTPEDPSDVEWTPSTSVSIWRRLRQARHTGGEATNLRRWTRFMGKVFAQQLGAVPADPCGCPTSTGSLPHAAGAACRPCHFLAKPQGCYDGVFCGFCHFADGHVLDPVVVRPRRVKHRSRKRRTSEASTQAGTDGRRTDEGSGSLKTMEEEEVSEGGTPGSS
mmetsp:Transcript_116852/g.268137  ORF Transcript_116852/g.268137 Transcript_116852/m.268137 type:complete len:289 (-) Transcript_116852:29-895(-)